VTSPFWRGFSALRGFSENHVTLSENPENERGERGPGRRSAEQPPGCLAGISCLRKRAVSMTHNSHSPARDSAESLYSSQGDMRVAAFFALVRVTAHEESRYTVWSERQEKTSFVSLLNSPQRNCGEKRAARRSLFALQARPRAPRYGLGNRFVLQLSGSQSNYACFLELYLFCQALQSGTKTVRYVKHTVKATRTQVREFLFFFWELLRL